MSISETNAAKKVSVMGNNLTAHQLISLLMEGMLERVEQAVIAIDNEDELEKELLLEKIVAIINGLRNSLNMANGGSVALNLEKLYVYMIERIYGAYDSAEQKLALKEVGELVDEVKAGWDEIGQQEFAQTA